MRSRRLWCALGIVVLSCLLADRVHAASDPDLEWWTIDTKHFRIHYYKELEPVAVRVATLSEAIHERLVEPLGYVPDSRTEVVLTDVTDDANGSATAVPYNTVRLFVTAPSDMSPLGDYDDWYLSLMTHEYTHILHVDNVSGVPSVVNAILGKSLTPNQLQPRWFIEGLAVVAETEFTSGGRLRSSLFDMYMRADVIEDTFARLDQISNNANRWPYGTLWYLYGSYFLSWIADVYGQDVLRAVSADYGASLVPWGINRAIRRQTGKTYVELYEGFHDALERRYTRQMQQVRARGLREGKRISHHGRHVYYPAFVPAAAREPGSGDYQLVYFRNDLNQRQGIYRLDLSRRDDREELFARTNEPSTSSFAPDGTMLFTSVVPYERIYQRTDIFALAPGKTAPSGTEPWRRRLTKGMRAVSPSVGPDGRTVAFSINNRGTTTLHVAERNDQGYLEDVRVLVPNQRYDQAFTPALSPDGRRIAYSVWRAGGFRDVRILDMRTGAVEHVTRDRALDTGPAWSPRGDKLYFSSDRTGIFNIYEYTLATGKLKQVTNVRTGALMPAVSEDGKLLAYVGYTSKGFDLFLLPLDPSRYLEPLPPPHDRPDPHAEPPNVPMHKHRYNPWPTLRPHNWIFDYAPGNFGDNALTVSVASSDVVGLHSIGATIVADPNAPLPMFSLDYVYRRLPVDMGVSLGSRVTPRSDYRINNQRPQYHERSLGVQTSLSYADLHEFSNQRVSISHNASVLDSDLPVASVGPPDPYADPTVQPLRGLISFVHLGYSYSNAETAIDAPPSAARGFSVNLGLDAGDEILGSEESIYAATYTVAGYFSMPWPGHHVLAIRNAGGMAAGTFARRGIFFVGGFNLESVNFLDTLTTGVFNGAFALRGYPAGAFGGRNYTLTNFEYRFPIVDVERGPATVPIYLTGLDGNLFLDWGGAFDRLEFEQIELFSQGSLIHSPQFHTGAGGELWLGLTVGYGLTTQLRLGYAYGFSAERLPGGQLYFIASSAF